jgi:hypothetical protein
LSWWLPSQILALYVCYLENFTSVQALINEQKTSNWLISAHRRASRIKVLFWRFMSLGTDIRKRSHA